MGSATTQALTAQAEALDSADVDPGVAAELFAVARTLEANPALGGALADVAAPVAARTKLAAQVFASSSPVTLSLLTTSVEQRWSAEADLIDGIEELAIRATAKAEQADLEAELFAVSRVIADHGELELALGARLADPDAKGALVDRVFEQGISEGTRLIVSSLVQRTGGRRVRGVIARAIRIVAAQRGRTVATVYSAAELGDAQRERLIASLSKRYGSEITVNTVVDPDVVGGIRVQIADDVIDGSISSRLAELRQKLAG